MPMLEVAPGVRLNYVVDDFSNPWEAPETVLLLHGAAGSTRRFFQWVPHLSRRYRVVRMDARGHGESSRSPADPPLTIDMLATDVVALLDALGVESAHVVGASGGGIVAQWLAATRPRRVASLSLVSTTPGLVHAGLDLAAWERIIRAEGMGGLVRGQVRERFGADAPPAMVDWFIADWNRSDPDGVLPYMRAVYGDISAALPRVEAPTLIVAAGEDGVVGAGATDALRAGLPHAQVSVLAGRGHNIADAEADACAELVAAFLARLPGPA